MRNKQLLIELLLFVKGRLFGKDAEVVYTKEELLDGCTEESTRITFEDREWLNAKPVGKEFL